MILFMMIIDCDLILKPYNAHPMTPTVKKIYIWRELEAAGSGFILQTVKTCGMNAEVVHIPEHNPKISTRFILTLSYQRIQNVGKAFMECKKVREPLFAVNLFHTFRSLIVGVADILGYGKSFHAGCRICNTQFFQIFDIFILTVKPFVEILFL